MSNFGEIGPEAQFKAFLEKGKFMIQRSRSTGKYVFFPRLSIPGTGETDLEWVEASGRGTVYSITVNHSKTENYNVALIDLDEGVRMMSHIVNHVSVPIGTIVQASIAVLNNEKCIVFTPIQGEKND